METPSRAHPAVYTKLREQVLTLPLPKVKDHSIHVVAMDSEARFVAQKRGRIPFEVCARAIYW